MTKDFPDFKNKEVVTISGATVPEIIEYVEERGRILMNYRVVVLHVGTNHFSHKTEWFLCKKYVNGYESVIWYVHHTNYLWLIL